MEKSNSELNITQIIDSIQNIRVRISDHADEEMQNDFLTLSDTFSSVINGEIIENYPHDKPFPSCLIFGMSLKNEPIHSVWGFNNKNSWAVLITVYRPDSNLWQNFRVRKKKLC